MLCNIRRYEQQRENLSNQSFNIEQQNFAIQGLKDTKATVSDSVNSFTFNGSGVAVTFTWCLVYLTF